MASLRVGISANQELVSEDRFLNRPLLINVRFVPEELTLDLTGLNVLPITCSPLDASWGFKLPSLRDETDFTVTLLRETTEQKLFNFDQKSRAVTIDGNKRKELMQGDDDTWPA